MMQTPTPEHKLLVIEHNEHIPDEHNLLPMHIDLSQKDCFTERTFEECMQKDHQRRLPWLFALIEYENPDGTVGSNFADGRSWNQNYFMNSNMLRLYPGALFRNVYYYFAEKSADHLKARFWCTEEWIPHEFNKKKALRHMLHQEQNPKVWQKTADCLTKNNNLDEAITWYNAALSETKSNQKFCAKILSRIANCYYQKRDFIQAIEYLKRALILIKGSQSSLNIMYDIGNCYAQLQDFDTAIDWSIETVSNLSIQNNVHIFTETLICLGFCYIKKRHYNRALHYLHNALVVSNNDSKYLARISYWLGFCHAKKKEFERAHKHFHKALIHAEQEQTHFTEILVRIAICYLNEKEYDLAISCFQKVLEQSIEADYPKQSILNNLGHAYELKNDILQAYGFYTAALVQPGTDLNPLVNALCLFATHKEIIDDNNIITYAQRLLSLEHAKDAELLEHQEKYPMRCTTALEEAHRLCETNPTSQT